MIALAGHDTLLKCSSGGPGHHHHHHQTPGSSTTGDTKLQYCESPEERPPRAEQATLYMATMLEPQHVGNLWKCSVYCQWLRHAISGLTPSLCCHYDKRCRLSSMDWRSE